MSTSIRDLHGRVEHREVASARVEVQLNDRLIVGRLRNISSGGLQVTVDEPLKRDTVVRVTVSPLEREKRVPIRAEASVRYCFLRPAEGEYRMGLKFQSVDETGLEAIRRFLDGRAGRQRLVRLI